MKNLVLTATVLWYAVVACAQDSQTNQANPIFLNPDVIPITYHGETVPLLDYREAPNTVNEITKTEKLGYHPKGDWPLNTHNNPNALPKGKDAALQTKYPPMAANKALTINYDGMGYTGVNPADPCVDVGPNHVVQMINGGSGSYIQVYDKTGSPIGGQVYFDNFMSMPGGAGDPIVLYDERADRWLLSEFSQTGNNMHVAISTTPDPTGTYYTYTFNAPSFPDYPKYSIWKDSYLIATNETGASGVYALDRTSLLAGTPAAAQRFTVSHFGTIGFQLTTPVSLNGTVDPPTGTPAMVMRMRDDAWGGAPTDALEIWEFDIDWTTPANTTLTQTATLATTPHDSELCGYTSFACIPQPGSGTTLDPLREILMNRIHYRNFGTHESIVCCHVTDVDGTDRAGIRWYELRRTGGTGGSWAIYQEGTYSPDTDNRWMPSIGISATGQIGLAYNVSSGTTYPSLRYTGRKECDPLGTMTEPETVIVAGSAANASNRYGDYNAMGLDPSDGETFWFTGMYNPASQWSTRVAAFSIASCTPMVQFGADTYSVDEPDANVSNGCLDYYVLDVPISIGADPSQPADVTVSVSGGTATQGVDFDINNTSFTFDGSTLSGTVQIWVYNDNYVEGAETITLDYTLNANGGDATNGVINQTVTVTINDDDLAPAAMTTSSVILTQDFESGMAPFTTTNPSGDTPFQIGNVGTTPNGAYAIPADNTTEFAWIDDDDCNCVQNDVLLEMPVLDLTAYTGGTMTFDSYYEANSYNGDNENAEVQVSIGGGAYTTVATVNASVIDGSWVGNTIDITPYVGNASVQFAFHYSDGTGWLYGLAVDNIVINGDSPISIQTPVNTGSGMTANLGPNETVHFYDPATSDVMMTIANTSAHDYGCVTVEVDRDGSTPTALQFASTNTADYLHSKTYTVVPTNNNPSGTFDVTLYYEEAEVQAWETFTGNNRNNAEVIKVAGNNRINDVTPANYGSFTIDNPAATLGAFNSDVTFTASFTNGFSGFGVGIYNVTTVTVTHTTVNTNPLCNGASNGSIVVTASGGTAPYQYSIDGGTTWQSSNTFSGLSAGTYNVIAEDDGGNQSTVSSEVLTNPVAVSYTDTPTNPLCNGSSNGSIVLAGAGGDGSYQYSIDGGSNFQGSGTFNGLSAATYNVVVEDGNGCQATGTITLSNPVAVSYTDTPTDPLCNGSSNGSIVLSGAGGDGSYQYSIDGGSNFQGSGSFTGLSAATYNVVVEDGNGCQAMGTVTLSNPTSVSYTDTPTDPICNGASDGSIVLAGAGGDGSYQYSIDGGSNFQGSGTFNGLSAATYNVVVEDGNGCQATGTVTLTDPAAVTYSATTSPENCGLSDGTITITGNGVGTLQYSIDGGTTFQASATFTGLSAGNYNIVVQDANSCQATGTETVGTGAGPSITNIAETDPLCNGGNGTIVITASGGSGPLQYSIDGGTTFQASGTFAAPSGVYSVVVEDGNGCQDNSSATLTDPAAMTYTASVTGENCGAGNGSITLTQSNGNGAIQYSINGGTTFQASNVFSGLSAGIYNIVIEDANGCQVTGSESVNSIGGATITGVTEVHPTCNGDTDGSITITASGGTAPLQYSFDGGTTFQAGNSLTNLPGGTYNLVVEDAGGCQSTGTSILIDPAAVSFTSSATDENCGAGDGTITITGAGGTGSLQYSIDGGTTFQSSGVFTGLSANTYNIVVEDANNCQATGTETVNGAGGPTISNINSTNITCNSGSDGSIEIIVSGGAAPIQYSIDGGTNWQSSNLFTGLTALTYNISVEDNNGCIVTNTVTLTEPSAITYSANATDENCGAGDGGLTITASGGTGALTYSIDGGANFQASGTFTGLSAGVYNVVIEDASGCQTTGTETVGSAGGAVITLVSGTDPGCFGDSDGAITVVASGGSGALQYSIDGGSTFQANGTFTGLTSGTYNIVVEDGVGCQTLATVTLTDPAPISTVMSVVEATCTQNDGSATVSATGGDGNYTYLWDDPSAQTTATASNLYAGLYQVVVTDGNNCTATNSVYIGNIGDPSIIVVGYDVSCNGDSDGMAVASAIGGVTPYNFTWDDPSTQTGDTAFNLTTGTYTVQVIDAAGCIAFETVDIDEPDALVNTNSVISTTCGLDNGVAITNVVGGTPPYSYAWDDAASQTTATAINLAAGAYNVAITDDNGCTLSDAVTIVDSDSLVVTVDVVHESCTDMADGSIATSVSGGTPPYAYNWDTGDSTGVIVGLTASEYTLVVTDDDGCGVTMLIPILTENIDCIVIPTAISPNMDGANDVWVIQGLDIYPDAQVEIYNRWGGLLYSTNDYQNDWDGTYEGKDLPAGVYYFVVTVSEDQSYTGSITVLR